jgi:glycosyltransferase involved in cell wall biosynthesis
MKEPLVSIIVTSYNYESFIRDAINSALSQTYPDIEVIVVDDGSSDASPGIIKAYEGKIKYVLKENGGQASAFNAGFSESKGQIILFLDSDDMLLGTAVASLVPLFSRPEVVKVHWLLIEIDAEGKKLNRMTPSLALSEGNLRSEVIRQGPSKAGGPPFSPPTSGNAWSRDFLSKVFPIPETGYKTCTDQYLQILAPVYGEIKKLNVPLGYYRIHGNNYSLNPLEEYMNEFLERYEQSCAMLHHHLLQTGIQVDPSVWPRDSWFHRIKASMIDILVCVPSGQRFILAGGEEWGLQGEISGREAHYFIEHEGQYWGPPKDDAQALAEIERQIENGIHFIFFTWTKFWFLDFYEGMSSYLKTNFKRITDNSRLIGFKLNDK